MSYSPGTRLAPDFIFSTVDDNPVYEFEAQPVAVDPANPVQDFTPLSCKVHDGINQDWGTLALLIMDNDLDFVDVGSGRAKSKFKNQMNLEMWLGQNAAGLQREFFGKVVKTRILRDGTNQLAHMIFAVGWGIKTAERVSNMKLFQKLDSGGIGVDNTDAATRADNVFTKIFHDTDHLPYRSLGVEPSIDGAGYAQVQTQALQFPDFQESFATWAHEMQRIAAAIGGMSGLDANRAVYLRTPLSVDSGFLLTTDINSMLAVNWNQNKLAYLNDGFYIDESTEKTGWSLLHGFGGVGPVADQLQLLENASYDLSTKWIAIPLDPTGQNIDRVSIKMKRHGTPADDGLALIMGQIAGGSTPDHNAIKASHIIPKEQLQALSDTTTDFIDVAFNALTITPQQRIFLVLKQYGDSSNTLYVSYKTGAVANAYWDSSDGVSWTAHAAAQIPAFTIRTYSARSQFVTLYDTAAALRFGIRELPLPMRDLQTADNVAAILQGIAPRLMSTSRQFGKINITAPYNLPPVGQYVRIVDAMTSLDINADVITRDYTMDMQHDGLGVSEVSLGLQVYD